MHLVVVKTEYMDVFCNLLINISYSSQENVRISSGLSINNTNKIFEIFYIGFKGLIIQNGIISEMFLCIVNVMEYGIQHFLQIIEHQCVMYNQLFYVYNTLDVDKMYGFCLCQKRTRDKGVIEKTGILLSTRDWTDG